MIRNHNPGWISALLVNRKSGEAQWFHEVYFPFHEGFPHDAIMSRQVPEVQTPLVLDASLQKANEKGSINIANLIGPVSLHPLERMGDILHSGRSKNTFFL